MCQDDNYGRVVILFCREWEFSIVSSACHKFIPPSKVTLLELYFNSIGKKKKEDKRFSSELFQEGFFLLLIPRLGRKTLTTL